MTLDASLFREPAGLDVRTYRREGRRGRVEVHTDEAGGVGVYLIVGSYAEEALFLADGSLLLDEPALIPKYVQEMARQANRDLKREDHVATE
jgi:hypothetical protein